MSLRSLAASIFVELFSWLGGLVLVIYGIRNGFQKQLMFRRGERIEGPAAMAWAFYIVLGLLGWACGVFFSWRWYQGRVE